MTTAQDLIANDPLLLLNRDELLALHKAWFDGTVYSTPDVGTFYNLSDLSSVALKIPTAKIITNRHLGLEITSPPQFKIANSEAQKWLSRVIKLNGLRGAMRGAAKTKSWAGDVGVLFTYKPSETATFGTAWQVSFIEPETYEVYSRFPSGVFKEVDIFTYVDEYDAVTKQMRRYWTRTRYSRESVITSKRIESNVDVGSRPAATEFDALALSDKPDEAKNPLGVIPFVIIQNAMDDAQNWWGASDYLHLTPLFHRINIAANTKDQGDQLRNRLLLATIDAEEMDVREANGVTALEIKSAEDGTTDRQAQLIGTPLQSASASYQDSTLANLMDITMEAAGVAQTGNAKELFGSEAVSNSALKTYYSMQAAVAQHKRDNWLGERADFGLSALVRKLFYASQKVESKSPFRNVEDLDTEDYDLKLEWPPMFALSAPEQQTLAAVAQQATDSGVPPEYVAPLWGQVLNATDLKAQEEIATALQNAMTLAQTGLITPPTPANGILGSGQGNGLAPNGGDTTGILTDVNTPDLTLPNLPTPTLSGK